MSKLAHTLGGASPCLVGSGVLVDATTILQGSTGVECVRFC